MVSRRGFICVEHPRSTVQKLSFDDTNIKLYSASMKSYQNFISIFWKIFNTALLLRLHACF